MFAAFDYHIACRITVTPNSSKLTGNSSQDVLALIHRGDALNTCFWMLRLLRNEPVSSMITMIAILAGMLSSVL